MAFYGQSGKGILDQQVAQLRELNTDVMRLEMVDVRGNVVLRAEGNNTIVFGDGVDTPKITDRELLRAIAGLETTAATVDRGRRQQGLPGRRAGGQAVGRSSFFARRHLQLCQRQSPVAELAVVVGHDSGHGARAHPVGVGDIGWRDHPGRGTVAGGGSADPGGPSGGESVRQFARRDPGACRKLQHDGRRACWQPSSVSAKPIASSKPWTRPKRIWWPTSPTN